MFLPTSVRSLTDVPDRCSGHQLLSPPQNSGRSLRSMACRCGAGAVRHLLVFNKPCDRPTKAGTAEADGVPQFGIADAEVVRVDNGMRVQNLFSIGLFFALPLSTSFLCSRSRFFSS